MRSEGFIGVLWLTEADVSYVVPVAIQDAGRHRSDVRHTEVLLPTKGTLRAGDIKSIRSTLTVTGAVSPACIAAIEAAMRREARARAFEDRHVGRHTETAVRL